MPLQEVDGTSIHYDVHENAAPQDMLFLHGNIASNRWWIPTLTELNKNFAATKQQLSGKIVLAELRGCGQCAQLPPDYVLKVDDLVNDMIMLTEAQGLSDVMLVGHSTGGLVANLLLARRPDLFKSAILVDPVGPKGITFPDDLYARYDLMINDRDMTTQVIGATIYQNDFDSLFFKTAIVDDTVRSLQNCGVQIIRAVRDVDVTEEIRKIDQPVLIFHGHHDWVLEEAHATDLQKLMKNAKFFNLPNNGHCMNMESPAELAREIAKFITENAPSKGTMTKVTAKVASLNL